MIMMRKRRSWKSESGERVVVAMLKIKEEAEWDEDDGDDETNDDDEEEEKERLKGQKNNKNRAMGLRGGDSKEKEHNMKNIT